MRGHITEKSHTGCDEGTHVSPCTRLISLNGTEAPEGRNHPAFEVPIVLTLWYQLTADHLSRQTEKRKKPVTSVMSPF